MPVGLRAALAPHDVVTAFALGWNSLSNGELLAAAEAAEFDAMITADSNIRYQQNLTGRRIALIVLSTNHWPTVSANLAAVREAAATFTEGGYVTVMFDRPVLRRRPFKPSIEC
jgi:hypothetical protein